jgi:hypothetical protein
MEPLTESIDLDIEESNELAFKIKMEGAASTPAKVRLVCEGKNFSYMFNGYGTQEPEVVQFTIPQMSNKIEEGQYSARVEVLVENRYFAPLHFQINFKKMLTVVAEAKSIQVVSKASKPDIKVTAAPVVAQKTAPQSTIKFEQRTEAPESLEKKSVSEQSSAPGKSSSLREVYLKKSGHDTKK